VPEDDIQYLIDLGLCRMDNGEGLTIANPIYREVLPRALHSPHRHRCRQIHPTWLNPDGSLNPERLLTAFIAFWRRHGEPLLAAAPYHEIAPHLVLMAFLQRVVNGNGTLEREYAIGRGRMDLCLRYGALTLGIELKVWRDGPTGPARRGPDPARRLPGRPGPGHRLANHLRPPHRHSPADRAPRRAAAHQPRRALRPSTAALSLAGQPPWPPCCRP
jgi:hypothetical protein